MYSKIKTQYILLCVNIFIHLQNNNILTHTIMTQEEMYVNGICLVLAAMVTYPIAKFLNRKFNNWKKEWKKKRKQN